MRLRTIEDIQSFQSVLDACTGGVYLRTPDGSEEFNLKSLFSQYLAIGRLLEEKGDELELFASNWNDEVKLMKFLDSLPKD